MLNGDVLTDLDLSAQIAHARGDRRARDARARPRRGPDRLRPRAAAATTARSPGSSRSPSPRRSTRTSSAPARTCWSAACSTSSRRAATSRSSARSGRRSSATGLYGYAHDGAYWLDIGTPERYLQGSTDILEGNVQTGVLRAPGRAPRRARRGLHGRRAPARAGGARRRRARSRRVPSWAPTPSSATACAWSRARPSTGSVVLADAVIGRGLDRPRRDRRPRRAGRRGLHRRPAAPCVGAGRDPRRGQRAGPRRAGVPGRPSARRRARVLTDAGRRGAARRGGAPHFPGDQPARHVHDPARHHARPRRDRRRRPDRPARRRPRRSPSTCATRCGRPSRPACAAWDSPGGLIVAGMGGSAIGGRLARAILGDQASRPVAQRRRLRAAVVDHAGRDRAVRELLRATPRRRSRASRPPASLGARRIVATTGGALAQAARAEGVPVLPMAGGLQPRAAVAYRPSPRSRPPRSAAPARSSRPRSTSPPTTSSSSSSRGAPTRAEESEAKALARVAARQRARHRRRRPHEPDRLPLEDADQRERQAARVRRRAAGVRPQRDRRLADARRTSARFSAVFLDDSDDTPRVEQRIRLTRRDHRRRRRDLAHRHQPRADDGRAGLLARAARRPRVGLPRAC